MVENPKYYHSPWESTAVNALSLMVGESEDKHQQYEDKNSSALTSQAAGFRFDTSKVESQWAACINLVSEYGTPLERGAYYPDEIEDTIAKYLDELNAAGYQDILDECAKQYAAWKALK